MIREGLDAAETGPAAQQQDALLALADEIDEEIEETTDRAKLEMLAASVRDLAMAAR